MKIYRTFVMVVKSKPLTALGQIDFVKLGVMSNKRYKLDVIMFRRKKLGGRYVPASTDAAIFFKREICFTKSCLCGR
jgi:hypothetical protein